MQEYSSKLLENAVNQIAKLPGIGKKTAVRLALHLLKQPAQEIQIFTQSITAMKNNIFFCDTCFNISDYHQCEICANKLRDKTIICVVQDVRDVIAIENTQTYKGVYHVLGGVIDPINGVGTEDLTIEALIKRVSTAAIEEIILALPSTTEGDTTAYYISKLLKSGNKIPKITTIARGVSFGNELENTDEITLSRSIANRIIFEL